MEAGGEISGCENVGDIYAKGYIGDTQDGRAGGIVGRSDSPIRNCSNAASIQVFYSVAGGIVGACHADIENCYNIGNVSCDKYNINQDAQTAGIAGYLHNGTAKNCYNTGKITANGNLVGGIVGNLHAAVIEHCYNTGNINTSMGLIGGICGSGLQLGQETNRITNCYNRGEVNATGKINNATQDCFAGGIVGLMYGDLEQCFNTANITGGSAAVGGISGGICYGVLQNCYNLGNIVSTGVNVDGSATQGGITGYLENANVEYCYNRGNAEAVGSFVGGIVGISNGTTMIRNCYHTGVLSGKTGVNPIRGLDDAGLGSIQNCYYLSNVTSGEQRTAEDMKTQEFANLLGGSAYWKVDTMAINGGYIILAWQENS